MAADNNGGSDIRVHEQTYAEFTRLMKSGTITVLILTVLIVLLISR